MANILMTLRLFAERIGDCAQRALDGLEADHSSRTEGYVEKQIKLVLDYVEEFKVQLMDLASRLQKIADIMR